MIYGIEEQKKAIIAKADHLRAGVAAMNALKPVIRAFDGKVYNCRFDDAIYTLSDDTARYCASNHCGWFSIKWNARRTSYSDNICLLSAYSCKGSPIKNQDPENAVFDRKRINAEKMICRMNHEREKLLSEAYKLEIAAADLEKHLQQISDTKKMLYCLVNSLPDHVIDICGLKRYY